MFESASISCRIRFLRRLDCALLVAVRAERFAHTGRRRHRRFRRFSFFPRRSRRWRRIFALRLSVRAFIYSATTDGGDKRHGLHAGCCSFAVVVRGFIAN